MSFSCQAARLLLWMIPAADTMLSAVTGMSAGIPKFVTVNLQQLNTKYQDGETVDLNTLQEKRLLNLSGREAKLPLKVSSACS